MSSVKLMIYGKYPGCENIYHFPKEWSWVYITIELKVRMFTTNIIPHIRNNINE